VRLLATQCDTWQLAPRCPAALCPVPYSGICSIRCGIDASVVRWVLLWQHCQDRHEFQRPTRYMPPFAHSLSRLRFGIPTPGGPPPRHFRRLAGFGLPLRIFDLHVVLPQTRRKMLLSVGYPRFPALPSVGEWRPLAAGRPSEMAIKRRKRHVP